MAKSLSIGETILIIFVRKRGRKRKNQVAVDAEFVTERAHWKGLRRKSENRLVK